MNDAAVRVLGAVTPVGEATRSATERLESVTIHTASHAWKHVGRANDEVLATFGPTRPRSRSKPLGRPIGTYDGTCVPACQRQRTNWLHGLPAMSGLCIESAFHGSHRQKGQRWPNRHFSPLGATFPSLRRSRGT